MPKVFRNSQVAHVWAQRTQDEGRSNNGNFYFTGARLYSYGSHFIVAQFVDYQPKKGPARTCVLVNSDYYSVSTSRMQSDARSAIRGLPYPVFSIPGGGANSGFDVWNAGNDEVWRIRRKQLSVEIFASYMERAAKFGETADRARKPDTKEGNQRRGAELIEEAQRFAEFFELPPLKTATLEAARELMAKTQAAAERKRKKADKERRAKERESFVAWCNGVGNYCPQSYAHDENGGVYMRVIGEGASRMLQTSRGAEVPFHHAKRVFQFLKLMRAEHFGQGDNSRTVWASNGRVIRVGHFTVDSVAADGSFKAGCHAFTWERIEETAKASGIFDAEPADTRQPKEAAA